jgi:chorismate dehydratase
VINVGYLPYLNAAPFYWQSDIWNVELVPSVPSEFGKLAVEGQVDAGIMSLQDLFLQGAEFEPLGMYGICAQNKAQSVLLFSHKTITELDNNTIQITTETSTSIKLLELILRHKYNLNTNIEQGNKKEIAWLLIGDNALQEKKKNLTPYVYDLGEEWTKWQNLPFVFARWVVRRSLKTHEKQRLLNCVDDSFKKSMANLQQVAASRASASVLHTDEICTYLSNFNYLIGTEEEAGLFRFKDLLEKI